MLKNNTNNNFHCNNKPFIPKSMHSSMCFDVILSSAKCFPNNKKRNFLKNIKKNCLNFFVKWNIAKINPRKKSCQNKNAKKHWENALKVLYFVVVLYLGKITIAKKKYLIFLANMKKHPLNIDRVFICC